MIEEITRLGLDRQVTPNSTELMILDFQMIMGLPWVFAKDRAAVAETRGPHSTPPRGRTAVIGA